MAIRFTEAEAARQCLEAAMRQYHEIWPLTPENKWAGDPPPPELCEVMGLVGSAIGHLENLAEYGPIGFDVRLKEAR